MKAHQRVIRERRATEDADADLFGRWWEDIDIDIKKAVVREISYNTAEAIILKYEWLGTMSAIVRHCYGIFFDGCCGGAVVYGDEYTENLGVWDKYGYTGKIICLSRGACTHWAHEHSASKLIRTSMAMLPERYKVVTCTTDHEAGEIGTIYQACGFHYVKMKRHIKYHIKGTFPRTRLLRQDGWGNKAKIIEMGGVPKLEHHKGRYFAFRGAAGERKRLQRAIAHLIRPYPKRIDAEQVSSREDGRSPDRAGGSSQAPLQSF